MHKRNNKSVKLMTQICSKITKKTPAQDCTNSTDYSKVYIINYEQFFLSYEPLNLKVDINQNFEVYLKN